jgi:hypothetical protein
MTGYEMTRGRNDRDEMTGDKMKGDESKGNHQNTANFMPSSNLNSLKHILSFEMVRRSLRGVQRFPGKNSN